MQDKPVTVAGSVAPGDQHCRLPGPQASGPLQGTSLPWDQPKRYTTVKMSKGWPWTWTLGSANGGPVTPGALMKVALH